MTSEANLGLRTHDDYTVGWVCALPKEQTAAIAMLDHRHADLEKPPNDQNTYTLGSISSHNIVIACLPKGKTGTNSAATVAAWMVSTFPSIKVGLLVGIGGGVPPKVRLGDVVVSTPTGQFPGVVQWDIGKAKEGGRFERTGSLNNPPTLLLTALTRLETEHDLNGSKISEYLDQLQEKWPRLASKYLRSQRHEDLLFRSNYEHVSEIISYDTTSSLEDSAEEENCEFCDRSQVVKKKPRDMRVHYGLIASGNQVIKDATLRNKLNKYLNDQVLCIEMEAAGLMNDFPCIVIRGISDYADSHKNDTWQEHAAAVAAAFAKELLGYVQAADVERERPVKDILEQVLGTISEIEENTSHTRAKLEGIENIKILDWLTSTNYGLQQSDCFQRRQPGSGQWLLDSTEFQSWVAGRNQTLFCPGMPGAGKTILTSIVVDYLVSKFRHGDVGIAYIYCSFHRHHEQNTGDLLASILKQLAETQTLLPKSVKDLYKTHQSRRTRPSIDELYETLQSVIASYSRAFIIVDALDECQTSNNSRIKFLFKLFDVQRKSHINIFATSRPIPEICDKFKESTVIEVRAHTDDVKNYLESQISHSDSEIMNICREYIKTKITEAAEGMFLLAQLYFDVIKDKRTQKKIKDALKELPIGRNTYDDTYEEAMKRIISQAPDTAELARLVLSWIVCARRPLKALELQHALAVEPKKYRIDEDNLLPLGDMASICAGLVTIEKESSIIRLVHYTTHEYLERTRGRWLPEAESAITTICTTYLLFNDFGIGPCNSCSRFAVLSWLSCRPCPRECEYQKRLRSFPLYHYAANHWGDHARACLELDGDVMNFLNCNSNIDASIQVVMGQRRFNCSGNLFPRKVTGLHLASYFDLCGAVNAILEYNAFPDPRDSHNATPLLYAARNGHKDVVRLLLAANNIDPDTRDNRCRTPLSYAAINGHKDVVRLLLATNNIDPDTRDKSCRTPLSYAADKGYMDIVKLLLEIGEVDPNSKDDYDRTPLLYAATNGHEDIVRLLLASGKVDPDTRDKSCRSPLSHTAEGGHKGVVKLLLATGKVDPDSKDSYYRTPLLYATMGFYYGIVKLLLATGKVDPSFKAHDCTTPLSYAAKNEYSEIVKRFLTIDICISSTCGYKHKVCDLKRHRQSLNRLVKRHIRSNGHYSKQLKSRGRENIFMLRRRRYFQQLISHTSNAWLVKSQDRLRNLKAITSSLYSIGHGDWTPQ
ncbi:ANK_REP_REGION domain-containing protein [Trichoderma simmonsii]|uniref:ANK_REP_REGION domain-containing protein n=1 Tax=Trichoderma simmonsii TaxID=1491479 RepID=A0A8G0L7Z3_9HYPO|nr:ANK_REP_REGION domain-containing protein [Trichoderma simmonsii]